MGETGNIDASNYDRVLVHLDRLGYAHYSSNGLVPMPWAEIESYINLLGYQPPRWLPFLLRKLSNAYANQIAVSDCKPIPSPLLEGNSKEAVAVARESVHKKLENLKW